MELIRKPEQNKALTFHDGEGPLAPPCLTFDALSALPWVDHLFSTRLGGVSTDEFTSMNFSVSRGDSEENVLENYRRITARLGGTPADVVCSWQTHTTNVRRVTRADAGYGTVIPMIHADVDGMITNEPGLILACFFADCVPLYVADPVHKAIGLAHSGWRGTVNRMGASLLSAMEREFGTDPADCIAAIGPSICHDCYEVGADVAQPFAAGFGLAPAASREEMLRNGGILWQKNETKAQLDLWRANELVLTQAGIRPENLSVTDVCTCCNPQILFSHRASHGKRGTLAAFMKIRE